MIRPELPVLALSALPGGPDPVVLCATARLAQDLRRAHGELQAGQGKSTWRALQSSTPALWLDALVSRALLRGEIPSDAMSGSFLGRVQESKVWEQAIARDAGAAADLFDREGMALAAMEAASLQAAWRIEVPEALGNAEYQAWSRWRADVSRVCRENGWRGLDEILAWRVACIERGIGGLPSRIGLAGFLLPDPVISRLLLVLEARGVELFHVDFSHPAAVAPRGVELADAEAECAVAAAWAAQRLAAAGDGLCRLRIAVADLPARRRLLDSALHSALHADVVGAGWAALEREHEFLAGSPLAEQPLVATALALLQVFASPRRLALAEVGVLLCAPGWSADLEECDARARIEAGLRRLLPPETSLDLLRAAIGRVLLRQPGLQAPQLLGHLELLGEAVRAATRRQLPSAWAATFAGLLDALGWPGQRPVSGPEAALVAALHEQIAGLDKLDAILGRIDRGDALRQLRRQCRELPFAAPRRSPPRIEICSLDDALAGAVDGLWVMGLNEGEWPPAPRPNPLLPAEIQRRAGVPVARADSLSAAAREAQALWCVSAREVMLSWSHQQGEKALRPSPLLEGVASAPAPVQGVRLPLPAVLEQVDDARAPPVGEHEEIHGGTGLLAAQAACPAWAFHRYRLGAAVLPAPTFGLDALVRGSLLHAVLEAFWRGRGLADLHAMDDAMRDAEMARVVELALKAHDRQAIVPLPPRLRGLESERLKELLTVWLELEAQRSDFRVLACEERHSLLIEGLPVNVVVDRVDQFADGRLAIIDYKSGRSDRSRSWAESRILEPQLPIYSALAFPDRAVAAVALARVTREAPAFLGVAENDGLLPEVKALDAQRRRFDAENFPDWEALRACWASRLREIAREVKEGVAAVVFEDDKALAYCEVLPLLRLAERQMLLDREGAA